VAGPADRAGREALAARMSAAVDQKYAQLLEEITAPPRLRRQLRRIETRDFFGSPRREKVRLRPCRSDRGVSERVGR